MRFFPIGSLSKDYGLLSERIRRRTWPWLRWIFPRWSFRHGARWVNDQYRVEIEAAKKASDHEKVRELRELAYFEASEFWDGLREYESTELLRLASKHHLVEAIKIRSDPANWEEGHHGHRYLAEVALADLARMVQAAGRERWLFRMEIMKSVATVLTALIGLAGAGIGLVAAWRR